jgi:hypothetical protein
MDFHTDELDVVDFAFHVFCLSGNFLVGDKNKRADQITKRGGLGSDQWKYSNFGTKVEKLFSIVPIAFL